MNPALIWLTLGWLAFFALHSLLASLAVKRAVAARWPAALPWYRLFYNLVAVTTLAPLLWFTLTAGGEPVLVWRGPWRWLANGLAVLAVVGFLWSLRWYDGAEFLGLRQLTRRSRVVEDQERFCISPLHRWVRHPWYALGLVLLWTRDLTAAELLATVLASAYFILGSRLEERKLRLYHGPVYDHYCERVPGLLPRPWRRLSAEEARRLERRARGAGHQTG